MNIVDCATIKDLLPLYVDDVLSKESKALISGHLATCESCKTDFHHMQTEFAKLPTNDGETFDVLKSMKKKLFKQKAVVAVVACAIAVAVIAGAYFGLTEWNVVPISTQSLDTPEVSELADGRIVVSMSVTTTDNILIRAVYFDFSDDGTVYLTPKNTIFTQTWKSVSYSDFLIKDGRFGEREITTLYVGTPNDRVLVWEKGMEVPPASAAVEERVLGQG